MIIPTIISVLCVSNSVLSSTTSPTGKLGFKTSSHKVVVSKPIIAAKAEKTISTSNPAVTILPKILAVKKVESVPGIKAAIKLISKATAKPAKKAAVGKLAKLPNTKSVGSAKAAKAIGTSTKATTKKPDTKVPPKYFRLLGQPVTGHQLRNGTFNQLSYNKAMKSLASRQKVTEARVMKPGKVKRSNQRWKRQSNDNSSLLSFGTDIDYPTPLITTFQVGTPPQNIPFFMNFESEDTVIFDSNTSCTADGGYDIFASSTALELKVFPKDVVLVESPSESLDLVKVKGEYVRDRASYAGFGKAVAATFIYAYTSYKVGRCYAQLGFLTGTSSPGTFLRDEYFLEAFQVYAPFGIAYSVLGAILESQSPPISYRVEILVAGRDKTKFKGRTYKVAVSRTRGSYSNYPWKLNFGKMQVNNIFVGEVAGTITFSLLHVGIHLPASIVEAIYSRIGGYKTYQPEFGPLVYTYPCRTEADVAFTIPGFDKAFEIAPQDFNMGFSPVEPGQCVGAVQLPNDSKGPVHTIGLVFFRSWYTTFNKNADGTPNSISIAKARVVAV